MGSNTCLPRGARWLLAPVKGCHFIRGAWETAWASVLGAEVVTGLNPGGLGLSSWLRVRPGINTPLQSLALAVSSAAMWRKVGLILM